MIGDSDNCNDMRLFTVKYLRVLTIIQVCFSSISLLMSLLVIFLYIFKRSLRTFVFRLILFLAISECLFAISKIMSIYKIFFENPNATNECEELGAGLLDTESDLCRSQFLIAIYSDYSTFFIVLCFSYILNEIMIKMNKEVKKKNRFILAFGFGVPLLLIIP
jgi:hypothetical protein